LACIREGVVYDGSSSNYWWR